LRPQFLSVLAMPIEMGRSLCPSMEYAPGEINVNVLAKRTSIRTHYCGAQ
jgi:hypothetical protein